MIAHTFLLFSDSISFSNQLWHVDCFRCAKCNNPVDTERDDILLLSDGHPICGQCNYSCQICGQAIMEEVSHLLRKRLLRNRGREGGNLALFELLDSRSEESSSMISALISANLGFDFPESVSNL